MGKAFDFCCGHSQKNLKLAKCIFCPRFRRPEAEAGELFPPMERRPPPVPTLLSTGGAQGCCATCNCCVNVWTEPSALQKGSVPLCLPDLLLHSWKLENEISVQVHMWTRSVLLLFVFYSCLLVWEERKARLGNVSWAVRARKEIEALFQKSPALCRIQPFSNGVFSVYTSGTLFPPCGG